MKFLSVVILFLLLTGCSPVPRFTSETDSQTTGRDGTNIFSGTASFYADEFHGRKTASGEIYDMNDLTAAHRDFPFDTIVLVTNLRNNKSVNVRINDRMPQLKNRLIDLSLAAAKKIDMINDGVVEVKLIVIKWGK